MNQRVRVREKQGREKEREREREREIEREREREREEGEARVVSRRPWEVGMDVRLWERRIKGGDVCAARPKALARFGVVARAGRPPALSPFLCGSCHHFCSLCLWQRCREKTIQENLWQLPSKSRQQSLDYFCCLAGQDVASCVLLSAVPSSWHKRKESAVRLCHCPLP